jgi:phosphoenolpyruvate carboxylase
VLKTSIERRSPTSIAQHQVALLHELRLQPDAGARAAFAAALSTINGIAAGMKTTG